MEYEDRVLCFVDILGFRQHIRQTVDKQDKDVADKIKNIGDAFLFIRDHLEIDKPDEKRGRAVTQFSDSIVISFPRTERSEVFWTLNELLSVQMVLVSHGLLCRGAVVEGKAIHNEKMIFGPAMVEAYDLEQKCGLFPRIILGASLLDVARNAHALHHSGKEEVNGVLNMLRQDTDEMYYIDYLTKAQGESDDPDYAYPEYLHSLCKIVVAGLKADDVSLRVKYQWMRQKLAPHVKSIKTAVEQKPQRKDYEDAYLDLPDL